MNFVQSLIRIINTGQSRSIILGGNIYDLFNLGDNWVPLIDFLSTRCQLKPTNNMRGLTQLIYRLNNPIQVTGEMGELSAAWNTMFQEKLEDKLALSNRNATFALELLRQLTEVMRRYKQRKNNLLIIIEAADMLIPESELSRMDLKDRQRIAIIHDWFSDPEFLNGGDTVILLSESRSGIHHRISRLPQVMSLEVPLPDLETRETYIVKKSLMRPEEAIVTQFMSGLTPRDIAEQTSGLSIHALRQLLLSQDYTPESIAKKVEDYMVGQLGDGVIEFKRPTHKFDDVIGFRRLKEFMKTELIPGFQAGTISGAAVGGPIGGGKTFICEAVAAELGIPVITLKNIRSKWYGETDQIFERLRRLLETFHRIVIFVDEADTQFGSVGSDEQATERRLTGKIQAMMSDVQLKGRVIWFLMTARIHLLSPDIRRPGRMDLIIPVLDPKEQDREDFLKWVLGAGYYAETGKIREATEDWSPAAFAMLRSQIKLKTTVLHRDLTNQEILSITQEILMPDIGPTREYQTYQALLNCTRKSLLEGYLSGHINTARKNWQKEILRLKSLGMC